MQMTQSEALNSVRRLAAIRAQRIALEAEERELQSAVCSAQAEDLIGAVDLNPAKPTAEIAFEIEVIS